MRHRVTQVLRFCYGHRLMGYEGKCRNLHGHNARVEIDVESDKLDELGMVVDFGLLKRLAGRWIDEHLDHQVLLCSRDPFVPLLLNERQACYLMDANPTAEEIAALIARVADRLLREHKTHLPNRRIAEVRVWETDDSVAVFRL